MAKILRKIGILFLFTLINAWIVPVVSYNSAKFSSSGKLQIIFIIIKLRDFRIMFF